MNRIARLLLVLVLLAAFLPAGVRSAQAQSSTGCAEVAASLQIGATFTDGVLNGSMYCVIYPPGALWNKDLVVFAHGFVFDNPIDPTIPPNIPWDQAMRGDLNLPGILVNLGYAFAIPGYHKEGLAIKEGIQDVAGLVKYIKKTNKAVNRVYVTGVSEGGLITTLLVQNYPQLFTGALETCGPVGDFVKQADYWSDFRSAFDSLFPEVLKYPGLLADPHSSTIYIPPALRAAWTANDAVNPYTGEKTSQLKLYLLNQLLLKQGETAALLQATGAPNDPNDPVTSTALTVLGILDYNLQSTNEGRRELALDPLLAESVLQTTNTGSPYFSDEWVDGIPVDPYTADPAALEEIADHYQTSGKLARQLVVMHTTGDPIVPFWHVKLYLKKVLAAGSLEKLTVLPVLRYGHCSFTQTEAVFAFYTMVFRSTKMEFTMDQVKRALPDAADQKEYLKLKESLK